MTPLVIALAAALTAMPLPSADTLERRGPTGQPADVASGIGCYLNFNARNSASSYGVTIDLKQSRIKTQHGSWTRIDLDKSEYAGDEIRIAPGNRNQRFTVWAKLCQNYHRVRLFLERRGQTYTLETYHTRSGEPRDLGDLMRFFD